jgi:hypothetical protein
MHGWWGRELEGLPPLRRFEVTDSNSKKVLELDGLPKGQLRAQIAGSCSIISMSPYAKETVSRTDPRDAMRCGELGWSSSTAVFLTLLKK